MTIGPFTPVAATGVAWVLTAAIGVNGVVAYRHRPPAAVSVTRQQ